MTPRRDAPVRRSVRNRGLLGAMPNPAEGGCRPVFAIPGGAAIGRGARTNNGIEPPGWIGQGEIAPCLR